MDADQELSSVQGKLRPVLRIVHGLVTLVSSSALPPPGQVPAQDSCRLHLHKGSGLVLEQPSPLRFQTSPNVGKETGISSLPMVVLWVFCLPLSQKRRLVNNERWGTKALESVFALYINQCVII